MTQDTDRQTNDDDLFEVSGDLESILQRILLEADTPEETRELLDELIDVAVEFEEMLETVDLTDLVAAIDWESVPDAVELEDLPEAIDEGNPQEAVKLRQLLAIADMGEVWENVDGREFWRQYRELDDELDDLSDEDDDDEFFDDLFDDDGEDDGFFDDDGEDDDGILDDDDDDGGVQVGGVGTTDDDMEPESIENAIQSQIADAVGEFRESLLEARGELAERLEANRAESERRSHTSDSRNPTAVSTMPVQSPRRGGGAFSTVPEETKYSTAPNRKRIYGSRFEEGDSDG